MELVEGRRLTGPNFYCTGTGAAVEVRLTQGESAEAEFTAWRARCGPVLERLGIGSGDTAMHLRPHPSGATFVLEAAVDALHTAVEVAEWAVNASASGSAADVAWLADIRNKERNPRLGALGIRSSRDSCPFLWDDDAATIGLGVHSKTWSCNDLPDAESLDTAGLGSIPVALVTGTNGKTTTARLLGRILRDHGWRTALTDTDGMHVDGDLVQAGDFTGPMAARRVLRDTSVQAAVLETARGGLMRRGLALDCAQAAIVTNVSSDHLGEWGLFDVAAMAEAKLTVRKGLADGGWLVLNAGNAPSVAAAQRLDVEKTNKIGWFSAVAGPWIAGALDRGCAAGFVESNQLVVQEGPTTHDLGPVSEIPITFGGLAIHNSDNALAAAMAALALGVPDAAIVRGLRAFRSNPADNPGRTNLYTWRGATLLVDFAHNPDGLHQVAAIVRTLPARRRLVILGQAGDRRDADVAALCDEAVALQVEHYVIKEALHYLRGRRPGEMPALIARMLRERGVSDAAMALVADELDAVKQALKWLQPGDVGVLLVHDDFAAADEYLTSAGAVAM
jgi:UDP-N-acetylmuramyl tripeptide synthase